MMKTLADVFGTSVYILTLDLFLENQEELMILREIARRIGRNPGSVVRVLPLLLSRGFVTSTRIGSKIVAYKLNQENTVVILLLEFREKLGEI